MTGKLIDSPWPFPGVYDLETTVMVTLRSSDQNRAACPPGETQLDRGWSASQRQAETSLLTLHLLACPGKTLSLYPDVSTFQSCQNSQRDTVKHENNSAHIWIYSNSAVTSSVHLEYFTGSQGISHKKTLLLRLCPLTSCVCPLTSCVSGRPDLGMSRT